MTKTHAATRAAERGVPARSRRVTPRPVGDGATLGARLRVETHDDHLVAERAFDLPRRLASIGAYGEVLRVLEASHRSCADTLEALSPALPAPLRDGPRRRRARLAADLIALDCVALPVRPAGPGPAGLDHALGAWYVHEGAALGGLLIVAEVGRRLPQALTATSFFAGEGRATAARWRAVGAVLAGWAPADSATADRVVAGARATFAALTAALGEDGP